MKPITAAVLAAFPVMSFAADQSGDARLETIVVTATREPVRITEAVADVSVISRAEIEQAGVSTLPELLSREPGIQYYASGGPGKQSGIFIRGAGPSQSLVLVDGLRFGSATSGGAALEQIPLDQIDRIEIVRGPMSALYGSDAVGGVVQIFTRKAGGKPKLEAFAGFGTYGTQSYSAGASGSAGDFRYNVRAGHDDSLGFTSTTSLARQPYNYDPDKDGYRRSSAGTSLGWAFAEDHDLQFDAQYNTGRSHYDAQDFMGNPYDAYDDHETSAYGLTLKDRLLDNWNSTLRIGQTTDNDIDHAPWSPEGGRYRTIQNQATWQNDIKVLDAGSLMLGVDWVGQKAEIEDAYDRSRDITSFFAGWSGHYGAHRIQLNGRYDNNSDFGNHSTGSAAWQWAFAEDWQLRLGAASAFRAPTFNDLYYPNFSNPDLQPERSRNYDAAIAWDRKMMGASLTAYRNRVTDMIQSDSSFIPQNVGRAKLDGATLAGYLKTEAGYDFSASVDYLDARDLDTGLRLIRRADWQGMASAGYASDGWRAGGQLQWVGARYDNAANTNRMGAYTLVNLYGQYQVAPTLRLEARVDNLFDQKYETAWGYGTAGASVFAGVRFMTR